MGTGALVSRTNAGLKSPGEPEGETFGFKIVGR